MKLGLDFGGTIATEGLQWNGNNYKKVPPIKDSFHHIENLISKKFGAEGTYIISKVTKAASIPRIWDWFIANEFFEKTGLNPYNVRFCGSRMDKFFICQELGITHLIDNRCEVFSLLSEYSSGFECGIILDPDPEEFIRYQSKLGPEIHTLENWGQVYAHIDME